jgi:hypothetical protein
MEAIEAGRTAGLAPSKFSTVLLATPLRDANSVWDHPSKARAALTWAGLISILLSGICPANRFGKVTLTMVAAKCSF